MKLRSSYWLYALLLLLMPRDIRACSCVKGGDAVGAVANTDVVFAGAVVSTNLVLVDEEGEVLVQSRRPKTLGVFHRVAVLKVTELFKGSAAPYVLIVTGGGGGDCGYEFVTGKTYLVYATRSNNKDVVKLAGFSPALTTTICSYTAPIESIPLDAIRKKYPPATPLFVNPSK